MTTLISWLGVDSRGPASIYLASDSRITWGNAEKWDVGRKIFASKKYPEILAYCGDVLFPSQVLGSIIDQIDNNLLIDENDEQSTKKNKIYNCICDSFNSYPKRRRNEFQILYASRQNSKMKSIFHAMKIAWNSSKGWNLIDLKIPVSSGLIDGIGSGTGSLKEWYNKWQRSDIKGTSRSVFSAFCDSLLSKKDVYSGGAPQLVGIYRKGPAKTFGIVYNNEKFFNGKNINSLINLNKIEWRNNLFERCDGTTLCLLKGAQRQPRPKNIK